MPSSILSALVRADVHAFLLDGELVLHDERRSRLFALNPTASFVWSSLASGLDIDTVAAELSQATGVALDQAKNDIQSILSAWSAANLLVGSPPAAGALPKHTPSRRYRVTPLGTPDRRAVRLMDRGLRIIADRDLAGAVETVFGHVFVDDRQGRDDWPTLTACWDRDRWVLVLDDELLSSCADRLEVVPMLYGNAAKLIYEAADCFAALHAAAVAINGRCALLPAVSTSGKSTLTAALIAAGYQYCTDDLAILAAAPMRLRPVPMKIGLKSGSWDLLANAWPELASQPSYRRADGQWIKYLDPRARPGLCSTDESLPIVAIVFPKFVAGSAPELRRLSRASALARMAEAGYDLSGELDSASVEALVSWFTTLECYELRFDDLDDAVAIFAGVLR